MLLFEIATWTIILSVDNFKSNTHPPAEVGQAKQPLPQAGGWLLEFVEQGRFLIIKPVRTGLRNRLLVFFLFVSLFRLFVLFAQLFLLAARNGCSHCIGPNKKQATLLV
jgi:hypothetical protein